MLLRPFSVPLSSPLSTAQGDISTRRGFLVGAEPGSDIRDGEHAAGVGEATPLHGWTESHTRCREALETAAAANPEAPTDGSSVPSDAPAARHGVSLAHLDFEARRAGVPLAGYLAERYGSSETPSGSVPANATVGDGSPEQTAAACRTAAEEGFECVKLKVGARPLSADIERVRAARDAVGADVRLRVDANGAWDRDTAERAVEELASLGVSSVEQPLRADDLAGHSRLRGRGVDIALDESLAAGTSDETRTPADARVSAVREASAADVLVLKPMALGGPDRTVEAATAASSAGIDSVITTTIDAVVARTAAVHVAAAIPDVRACGLATGKLLAADLASDPAPISAGRMNVPDGPGIAGSAFDHLFEGGHVGAPDSVENGG